MSIYPKNKDDELFQLIRQSNAKALKELYEKYFQSLCRFSFRYVKSIDLTEEVVSDVFLNIWLNRKTIEIKTSLKAYLFTAVRNRSLNYALKEKYNFENLDIVDNDREIRSDYLPYEVVSYKELESAIESVIKKLPPQRQLIFRMNRIDGLKYKEIAEVLSISINTVQNHMVKAVKFISKHYPFIKSLFTSLFVFFLR